MFDIDAAMAARRQRSDGDGNAERAPDAFDERWRYAYREQLHRRWLALHRSEHWSLERIAELDGVTLAQVYCGIVLAMRHEPRRGRMHRIRRMRRMAG
ncbi:MAG: hypothetical protein R3F29_10685 [Planctomycetota bacterium]